MLEVARHLEVPRIVLVESFVQHVAQLALAIIDCREFQSLQVLLNLRFLVELFRHDVLCDKVSAPRPAFKGVTLVLVATKAACSRHFADHLVKHILSLWVARSSLHQILGLDL